MSVGMPATIWLHHFGALVRAAFGEFAYHVGSSLRQKDGWRDVDVRVMLADDVYAAMGLGDPKEPHRNARWVAMCLAFSALGKQMTGLPIDFQIQTLKLANEQFGRAVGAERSCIGWGPAQDLVVMPPPAETDRATDQLFADSAAQAKEPT